MAKQRDHQNQKIRNLREDNARNMARAETQKRRELDNLREADKAAYDALVDERKGMVKEFNRIHGDEIKLAHSNADQRVQANYESFKKRNQDLDARHKRLMTDQRRKLITENNDRKKENELHLNQVQDSYKNDRERLALSHSTEKQRIQDRYESNLEQIRFKDSMERDKMRGDFNAKIKEMDQRHASEMVKQQQDYEKQIMALKERQQKQIVAMKKESTRCK